MRSASALVDSEFGARLTLLNVVNIGDSESASREEIHVDDTGSRVTRVVGTCRESKR